MLIGSIPTKFTIPFAASAGAGFINAIPTLPSSTPGLASFTTGFPTPTFQPEASGGNPPYGADFNGILNAITKWNQWQQAGGPIQFDSAFAAAISGYPQGAILEAATLGNGRLWISQTDGNSTNPDSGGANWLAFPDLAVQLQRPNYGVDSGSQNHLKVTLFPAPASLTELKGVPLRIGNIVAANAVNNPDVQFGSITPITIVNPDGSVLGLGQITAGCTVSGIVREDGKFQIDSPSKLAAASTFPFSGVTIPWWNETVPSGWLELDGSLLLMATYPSLWSVLGTRYGGDGVTTFKLPDTRGQFFRGWDHGRGLDPGPRTNSGGGISGDHVGTLEAQAVGSISLSGVTATLYSPQVKKDSSPSGTWENILWTSSGGGDVPTSPGFFPTNLTVNSTQPFYALRGTMDMSGSSGPETRSTNINPMWIIKT